MKKILAMILSVIFVLSCVTVSFAANDELSLIVVTDTHFSDVDSTTPIKNSTDENPFGHVVSNGKLVAESAAIYDEFFKEAAASDADYVVITGDISDNGIVDNVDSIVEKLEEFERTSGKTVIACMGNHETYHLNEYKSYIPGGLTGPEFREHYKNLGYDIALEIDEQSASYTVDLNSKYRMLVIDTNALNGRLVDWIEQQAISAKEDGKYLISAGHFSLFPHYMAESIASGSVINSEYNLPDKFIDWGIKFYFSGHTHELDTAQYTNDKGIVYDITSGALTTYPANYKTAVFTDSEVKIDTKYIEKVDMSLVPEGLAKEAYDLLENDFRAYARKMFTTGAQKEISYYINANYLINAAHLDSVRDEEIINLIKSVVPRFNEAIRMPLYGENSLSVVANKHKYPLPGTEYSTLFGAMCEAYCNHCAGNENCSVDSPLGKLAMNGIATALVYALDELSEEDFQTVINWALDTFELPVNIPPELRDLAANALYKYDEIEYIAIYIASPLIDDFLNDPRPDDVTATFPGYSQNEVKTVTFWTWIHNILNSIKLAFNAIFSVLFK